MTRVYLIRHAESVWNQERRIQGQLDSPLSSLGREQAEQLSQQLARESFQRVSCSDLQRARETADIVGQHHGVTVEEHEGLREIALGAWEGLTAEEVNARYEGKYQVWLHDPTRVTIDGAECAKSFQARALAALDDIVASSGEGSIAIITHGGVIAAYLARLLAGNFYALLIGLRLDNTGVTIIDHFGEQAYIHTINDNGHLTQDLRSVSFPGLDTR